MHNLEIKRHSRGDLLLLRSSDLHSFRKIQRDVDDMGLLSSAEQHLSGILTTLDSVTDQDNTLYCLTQQGELIGMLKIGTKRLYLYNGKDLHCGSYFYIQRDFRKRGLGLVSTTPTHVERKEMNVEKGVNVLIAELFNFMLRDKAISPSRLCYDNPSYKLRSFLKKHFSPCVLIRQPNNFVIFAEYFGEPEAAPFQHQRR
ncbi:alpha-tubulin N-acetyltransferase [Plasmodium inui San Antonio 1]|uniref:Alpha-tubulin N-acetyltransferase n=1 Tax=Plasmodium inui San Antonio 1 TaxID=1237626 RepID=W7A4S2_9APIC|nr:alpha-tubulin N-acetyltransferase [Plasmodium inui San Antonio 1]EUD68072.1 alpha-tubulin N-acetyltransferase [Plasmodium inui San Antonio 1]